MTSVNPEVRPTLQEVMDHAWVIGGICTDDEIMREMEPRVKIL
jgi:hypothetical protein